MRIPHLTAALMLAAATTAQTPVSDIGMTTFFNSGPTTAPLGQQCGPVTCTALPVGATPRSRARTFTHASAPVTPFAIAVGFPGPCTPITGVSHGLLLDASAVLVVAVGVTSTEPFVPTPCQQGLGSYTLTLAANAPIGVTFRVQGVGQSHNGQVALGPALESMVQ